MAEAIKVVCIDDEPDVCTFMKALLEEKQEFAVTTLSNPLQAEQVIRQIMPQVILLDIVMPRRLGIDIIAALRKDNVLKQIPIVVVSGKGEMVFDKKKQAFRWLPNTPLATKERSRLPSGHSAESFAQLYQVEDYVSKPFSTEVLLQVIYDVLSRQAEKMEKSGGGLDIEPSPI